MPPKDNTAASEADPANPQDAVVEPAPETGLPTPEVAPMERGISYLRGLDLEPLRLWTLKGPKGVGGTISGVFLQAESRVVILQQLASGKFVVFNKAPD